MELQDFSFEALIVLLDLAELQSFIFDKVVDLRIDLLIDDFPGILDLSFLLADLVSDISVETALFDVVDAELFSGYAGPFLWKFVAETVR